MSRPIQQITDIDFQLSNEPWYTSDYILVKDPLYQINLFYLYGGRPNGNASITRVSITPGNLFRLRRSLPIIKLNSSYQIQEIREPK